MNTFFRLAVVSLLLISIKTASQGIDVDNSGDQSEFSAPDLLHDSTTEYTGQLGAHSQENSEHLTKDKMPNSSSDLSIEPQQLRRTIEHVEYRLNSNEDAHHYLNDSLMEIESKLQELTTLVREQILNNLNVLQLEIDALNSNSVKNLKLSESESKANTKSLPFRLISIDQWESEWSAVLTMGGNITITYPNETRAGWTLLSVNPLARSATFYKRSTGAEETLFVTE